MVMRFQLCNVTKVMQPSYVRQFHRIATNTTIAKTSANKGLAVVEIILIQKQLFRGGTDSCNDMETPLEIITIVSH